jgi:hypothetical protein
MGDRVEAVSVELVRALCRRLASLAVADQSSDFMATVELGIDLSAARLLPICYPELITAPDALTNQGFLLGILEPAIGLEPMTC